MTVVIKPYSLDEARRYTRNAIKNYGQMHEVWVQEENLYATGDVEMGASEDKEGELVKQLWGRATLERANVVLPDINIMVASVTENNPEFIVKPVRGVDDEVAQDAAQVAEELLNHFWHITNAQRTLRKMIKDQTILGPSFCKVGWSSAKMEVPRDIRAILDDQENGVETPDENELITIEDKPFVEYVRPHDILVAQGTQDLESARWVCQRVRKPVDELRAAFDIPSNIDIEATRMTDDAGAIWGANYTDTDDSDIATFYEFYDQRTKMMTVFQDTSTKPLWFGPTPTHDGMSPFVMIRNYQRSPLDFYGFGDLLNVAPLQVMLNEVFTLMMDNMRRSGNMSLVSEDMLDADLEAALSTPRNGKVIPVKLDGMSIRDAIMEFNAQPLPADLYQAQQMIQDLIAQIFGLSEFQMGQSGASRMPGTAAAAIEGHTSLRATPKVTEISAGASKIGEKLLGLAAIAMTEVQLVNVFGEDGIYVKKILPDQVSGTYMVEVKTGSLGNPATRQQRAMEEANTLVPLAVQNGFDPEPILRAVFRDFGKNPDVMLKRLEPTAPAPAEGGQPPIDPASLFTGNPQDQVGGLASQTGMFGG